MRNLLIVLVLGITALTFYSALWFKSESIEDDITARVTDDLTSTGADNIDISVDGRHVTLSGVVYDEATEDGYLDTANNTYGALGPIDGLTIQADGGYVNAIKTADGITLRGTVPNAQVRASLLAEAEAATDGAVDDQMIVAGPQADWQDEAVFGVSQLAALTSGTLTAAEGAYALSGSTDVDPNTVTAGLTDRDGWSAFVSSPVEQQGLASEIDRLNVEVMDRDGKLAEAIGTIAAREDRITELETDVSGLQADVSTLTQERDTVGVELADLRASLTQDQANAEGLRVQLQAATATIDEKDQTIDALTVELEDGKAQIGELETELENRQAALGSTDERVVALRGELDTANGTIANLTGQIEDRDATIEGLTGQVENLSANTDQSLAALSEELAAKEGMVLDLTQSVADRDAQIEALTGALRERDASVTDAAAQIAALSAAAQSSDGTVLALEEDIAELNDAVAQRDETIATLQARPAPIASSAEQCARQATGALEGSRINFETGSAQISSNSVELLERLTGIALACVSDGLAVEIGGHTDAQGAPESNQALSEARAQAVLAFMAERGVPTDGLNAVGYGESQPIASNDTSEGRAQNRRISFDWQAR